MAADNRAKLQNEAEKYLLQGKTFQAIGEYSKIVQNNPEDVLTLNTIGDLYLRMGSTEEANRCFVRVAESYVRNNFFLKAIAVYKKILRADPDNAEINATIASLYAKQGLNTDACNQYLHLAHIHQKTGDRGQVTKIYETIADLDPANAGVQKKLAEIFLAVEEDAGKGRRHLLHAARALAKAKDHQGAIECYTQAATIAPMNLDELKPFLECCLQSGDAPAILEQLNASLEADPDNLDIREMLGGAYLSAGNPAAALETFRAVVAADESRCECLLPVVDALMARGEYIQASECLDPIIPTLINRRKTDRAARYYEQALEALGAHLPTMEKLASVYLSAGDIRRHLEVLDRIADHYIEEKNPEAALEQLEKILQANPESKKHLDLHKVVFVDVHPDTPYVPPVLSAEPKIATGPIQDAVDAGGNRETIVEADLLINYGMKEKALGLLENLEALDPNDKNVRTRLLMLYRDEEHFTKAAEQCLLLAALYRRSNDEDVAEKYLSEARQLDPDLVDREKDTDLFARKRGILPSAASDGGTGLKSDLEVDLSGDLLDVFFTGNTGGPAEDLSDLPPMPGDIPGEYTEELASVPPAQSIEEKIQEVDFYIRLGFSDEARSKLNEIARINPDNPELPSRYDALKAMEASGDPGGAPADAGDEPAGPAVEDGGTIFQDVDIDAALENFCGEQGEGADPEMADPKDACLDFGAPDETDAAAGAEPGIVPAGDGLDDAEAFEIPDVPEAHEPGGDPWAAVPESADCITNDMFSDLLDEVSSLDDIEIGKESFEDHFSLGTAYRDMELIEEAIKEFQTALRITEHSKDAKKLVQCCGMLSTCFLKKSMPRSALRWCQTGLNVEEITQQEALALRYDMGLSHAMEGNRDQALQCFDKIFNVDPGYRDVALKIDEIRSGRT